MRRFATKFLLIINILSFDRRNKTVVRSSLPGQRRVVGTTEAVVRLPREPQLQQQIQLEFDGIEPFEPARRPTERHAPNYTTGLKKYGFLMRFLNQFLFLADVFHATVGTVFARREN